MSLTLNFFELVNVAGQVTARTLTQENAEILVTWSKADLIVRPAQITLEVGDEVKVPAFGRWRSGTVTKLGRTKVVVDFQQNAQGARGQRSFDATEIRKP